MLLLVCCKFWIAAWVHHRIIRLNAWSIQVLEELSSHQVPNALKSLEMSWKLRLGLARDLTAIDINDTTTCDARVLRMTLSSHHNISCFSCVYPFFRLPRYIHCVTTLHIKTWNFTKWSWVYGDVHLFPVAFFHLLLAELSLVLPRGPAELASKDGRFKGKPFEKGIETCDFRWPKIVLCIVSQNLPFLI